MIAPIDAPEHFEKEAVVERSARKHAKDSPLIRALGLAHYWQRLLDEGKYWSLTEIAAAEGIDRGQANRIAPLTRLAPEIIHTYLSGGQANFALERLNPYGINLHWGEQIDQLQNSNLPSVSGCRFPRKSGGEGSKRVTCKAVFAGARRASANTALGICQVVVAGGQVAEVAN